MTAGPMTCMDCGGVLPTHNAWCDALRPRPVPAPAEPSAPCPVCEAAHAFCRSGAPASTADFLKSAIVQERKAKEKAEAEAADLRAALDSARKALSDEKGWSLSLTRAVDAAYKALGIGPKDDVTIAQGIERLRADLDVERMRLAACGVAALQDGADRLELREKVRPEYRSDSLRSVESAVDALVAARAALNESERSVAEWRKYAEDSGNRVAELVHAHYAERAACDALAITAGNIVYRTVARVGSRYWQELREARRLLNEHHTRRAAEANPSAQIGNVVARAVAAERERCARIVEAFENTDPDRAIAAAAERIRSGK